MKIRQFQKEDIEAAQELISKESPYLVSYKEYVYWILSRYYEKDCFVAEKKGNLAGLVLAMESSERNCLFVWQIVTAVEERHQYIGTALLEHILYRAQKMKLDAIEIGVNPDNQPCNALIESVVKKGNHQLQIIDTYTDTTFSETIFRIKI